MKALKEGMIGMSFTNTSPLMAPTRSKEVYLYFVHVCLFY